MEPLFLKHFKPNSTYKDNLDLKENAIYFSSLQDFEGKLQDAKYSLKFPILGKERYVVNNSDYEINQNNFIVCNAGEEVEASVKSKKAVLGICMSFTTDYISGLCASIEQNLENGIDHPFNENSSFTFLTKKNHLNGDSLSIALNRLKQAVLDNTVDTYDTEQFYISIAEKLILRESEIRSDIERLPHIRVSTRHEIYRRICLMNDYIHDNFKNDISLDSLSKICMLSKFHALRCYHKIYNITPYQKIISLRLLESKELIRQGVSVNEAAFETNFSNYRTFSKHFKRHFNLTPSQFKAQCEER